MKIGENRKQELILASIKLMNLHGFHELTFQQLAQSCGISQPAVYRYFNNKIDLLRECCLYAAYFGRDFIDNRIDQTKNPKQRLLDYLYANIDLVESHKEIVNCLMAMFYFSSSEATIAEINHATMNLGRSRIEEYIHHGNYAGDWSQKDVKMTSSFIHSSLTGSMIKIFHNQSNAKSEKKILLNYVLNSLRTE